MGGADTETAMYFGLNTVAAFFFSWLIAQELDPDRKLGGIIGGGLSIVAALTLGEGNVLVLLGLQAFILRMLNRTGSSGTRSGIRFLDFYCLLAWERWILALSSTYGHGVYY